MNPVTSDNCGVLSVTNDAPATFPVGITTVTWTVNDIHGNSNTCQQTVTVINNEAEPYAGPDDIICQGFTYTLSQSSASIYLPILWQTTGDGTFNNPTTLHPVYTPGSGDISGGTVYLILNSYQNAPCQSMADSMLLTISPAAIANAGPDGSTCQNQEFQVTLATASNYTSILWTHNGLGTLLNPNTLRC